MKQNLQTSFNVIKLVKTVAEKLENSKLDTSVLMSIESDCNDLSVYLGIEKNRVMIFCVIFILIIKFITKEGRTEQEISITKWKRRQKQEVMALGEIDSTELIEI